MPERSPAMGVALVALFVALGGVSYGAAAGSIDSREIRNNTVRAQDIRNNTVRSKDVRNGSLLTQDFKTGQLPAGAPGAAGARGQKGDPGPAGTDGTNGNDGADGVLGYVDATPGTSNASLGSNSVRFVNAVCPAGRRAVGGGLDLSGTSATEVENFQVLTSQRSISNQAEWQVGIRNTNDTLARTPDLTVRAVCVQTH